VEYLQASALIVGGLVVLAWVISAKRMTPAQIDSVMPVQSFLAFALVIIGASWIMRGPLRVFHGPTLVVIALAGLSYGAVAGGACLAFPKKVPKPVQGFVGTFCLFAGVLLLLFQLRVIKPM